MADVLSSGSCFALLRLLRVVRVLVAAGFGCCGFGGYVCCTLLFLLPGVLHCSHLGAKGCGWAELAFAL
eukprot:5230634-Ditylum_brightwellii.AAC.1